MRRIVEHPHAFVKSANDDVIFLGVDVFDGFFEIADAAVNDFGGGARGSTGEVARFEENHGEAAEAGIESTSSADGACTDDANIKRFSSNALHNSLARFHLTGSCSEIDFDAETKNGGVGDVRIGADL